MNYKTGDKNLGMALEEIFYEEKKDYDSDNSKEMKKEEKEETNSNYDFEYFKPRKRKRNTPTADSQKVIKLKKELNNLMKDSKMTEEIKKKVGYKLKNRISAQQSRDRQKAYIEEIELKNKKLKMQNEFLILENQRLKKENQEVKEQAKLQNKPPATQPILKSGNMRVLNKVTLISFTFITAIACICTFSVVNYHYRQNYFMKQKFVNSEKLRVLNINQEEDM